MRLVSFNLLHGRSVEDGLVDGARVRRGLEAFGADVLAMQEVDRGQDRSGGLDLTALAAEALGAAPADARFAPTVLGTPGGEWRAATGDEDTGTAYGVALVSRRPVSRWVRIPLGTSPVRLPVQAGDRTIWVADEPRVALAAVLAPPSPVGTVVSTHLSFGPGWNVAQLRRLARALRGLPRPCVLLGDLNLPGPVPAAVLRGWRSLGGDPTFPRDRPRLRLDHALVADGPGDPLPPVIAVEAIRAAFSDHRALVVDLDD